MPDRNPLVELRKLEEQSRQSAYRLRTIGSIFKSMNSDARRQAAKEADVAEEVADALPALSDVAEAARLIDDFDCLVPEFDGPGVPPQTCIDLGAPDSYCSNCKMRAALERLDHLGENRDAEGGAG